MAEMFEQETEAGGTGSQWGIRERASHENKVARVRPQGEGLPWQRQSFMKARMASGNKKEENVLVLFLLLYKILQTR